MYVVDVKSVVGLERLDIISTASLNIKPKLNDLSPCTTALAEIIVNNFIKASVEVKYDISTWFVEEDK